MANAQVETQFVRNKFGGQSLVGGYRFMVTEMEGTVVFPDAEMATSNKHGVLFTTPTSRPTSGRPSKTEVPHLSIRPHSAKQQNSDIPARIVPTKTKAIRPWSASAKSHDSRKVSRPQLRKPHFKAPPRSPALSISSDTSSLITAVGLANDAKRLPKTSTPTPHSHRHLERYTGQLVTPSPAPEAPKPSPHPWALMVGEPLLEIREPEPDGEPSRYPTVDTWLLGSPHDSDEYDTDIDVDAYVVRNIHEEMEKARLKKLQQDRRRMRNKTDNSAEIPIDPTGKSVYDDQCQKQGLVPVSYMQRHLGDKNLRMRHHYLGGNGTKPLALALKFNTVTEDLDIGDNYIEAEGAAHIARMLRDNMFITNLEVYMRFTDLRKVMFTDAGGEHHFSKNISSNFIGREGFSALCEMLETNTALRSMSVAGNQLTDACAECLIEGLKNNASLVSLDISNNDIGDLGGVYLGGALSVNVGLVDVDASWNSLRNKGAAAVVSSLNKNKSLEVLDLSWNGLGPTGAAALRQTLRLNTNLKVLDLTNNRLNTKAAQDLAWGLARNFGLESLVLNLNPIKDEGVEAILKAADKHPNLHLLSLEEVGISRANYHLIRKLETEKDITILHGGVGGYNRVSTATSMIKLFGKFITEHRSELQAAFGRYDRNRSGKLPEDDVKSALKDAGLRLTPKQLTTLVEEINYRGRNIINYRNILSGQILAEYFQARPSRALALKTSQQNDNILPDYVHRQLTVT